MSSSDRRHPVPAQLSRHLPSSGPSANAEHSWLAHPAPCHTLFPAGRAEELPQIFCPLEHWVFCKCRTLKTGIPCAHGTSSPARSRRAEELPQIFLALKASVLLQMQNTQDWNTLRPATHYPSPQTTGWAGGFEFVRNSWQEVESRSTLSIAGHPQGARCLPGCHRAACASEASWPRMTAMEADAGEQDGRRVRWTAFHLRPAS